MSAPDLSAAHVGMVRRLSPADFARVAAVCHEVRTHPAREPLSLAGQPLDESLLLIDGWIGRRIGDPDGRRRRLVAIEVAGDFVDLHSLPLGRLDHAVVPLTEVRVAAFRHDDLRALAAEDPALAERLWALTLVDASIHRHWAFRTSALRAMERLADFICEMEIRLHLAGRVEAGTIPLPLTQDELGEACGLTGVHVNRALRDLREGGYCTHRSGIVTIHDRAGLNEIAGFSPEFLYLADIPDR